MDIFPQELEKIAKTLINEGFQCYLVGGSLRDLLLKKELKDLDVTTDAKPEDLIRIFPNSFYNNEFGTVGIKTEEGRIIEATTFRKEGKYSDQRHPDEVVFTKKIESDLKRRDFTINALALNLNLLKTKKSRDAFQTNLKKVQVENIFIPFEETLKKSSSWGPGIEGDEENLLNVKRVPRLGFGEFPKIPKFLVDFKEDDFLKDFLIDLFSGKKDLENNLIRAVNNPDKRFKEDALRLIRAVRFACELGFKIEKETARAIRNNAHLLKNISRERIRDEVSKIILSPWPAEGIVLLQKLSLLKEIFPSLEAGVGVSQNWHHIYSVFEHNLFSLKFCPSDSLEIRLASLFHDIAKPKVKKTGKAQEATFYFHEVEGEKMARNALFSLRFKNDLIDEVGKLVRFHMFNFDHLKHTESTVRRMIHRVGGLPTMQKLLLLRLADRMGSGCHQGEVFKTRKLKYFIEKVSSDPISLKQLKLNGGDLIKELKIKPGPIIGQILEILLSEVLKNPNLNKREVLLDLSKKLFREEQKETGSLLKKKKAAEMLIEEEKEKEDLTLQEKYRVKNR